MYNPCRSQATDKIYGKCLSKCYPAIKDSLDPDTIIPHLDSHHLLSFNDLQELSDMTRPKKIEKIRNLLPTKGKGWFDKFLSCLVETANEVPVHGELKESLERTLEELKGNCRLTMKHV